MKHLLPIIVLSIFSNFLQAQTSPKTSYLIIRMSKHHDDYEREYFRMNAEATTEYSKEIGSLINYKDRKNESKRGIASLYYFNHNDTTSAYFNYFRSETEALQFLADLQWQLISVTTEVSSAAGYGITDISSKPVYYFKKDL